MTAIVWFRRDLRVGDQPTFLAAAGAAARGLAVFVLDPALLTPAGAARTAFLYGCLRELDASLGGRLLVLRGDPAAVLPEVAAAAGAGTVHVAADHGPYGVARDRAVRRALAAAGVELVRTGSPYAVEPGSLHTVSGTGYSVYTPFRRAWLTHGVAPPARTGAGTVDWLDPRDLDLARVAVPPDPPLDATLPTPGEAAALRRWREFADTRLAAYGSARNHPDRDGTSRMSPYLRFGCVHPRTLLADLRHAEGAEAYVGELAWRDFYADVLARRPETSRRNHDPAFDALPTRTGEEADRLFAAWRDGRTGYPIVDAGMRQMRAEGWMHNRVRMITASFLVKDLHLPWQRGARHFMRLLADGDLASNQHNWQWVAGSGTDAAPYVRVFNPTVQGERFDPRGDYVRAYVPELAGVTGGKVHQPWRLEPPPAGYPPPVVDHQRERRRALTDFAAVQDHP